MSKRTSPYERELDSILASFTLPKEAAQAAEKEDSEGPSKVPGIGIHAPATGRQKPSLLLHACCGPCSSYVIEYLAHYFAITIFYYNPNIHPKSEYERRRDELLAFLPRFPEAKGIQVVEGHYDTEDFYRATRVKEEVALQTEAEKGERCRRCYEFRMRAACQYASEHQFDWFTTTLSISPFKDAVKINAIGKELEQQAKQALLEATSPNASPEEGSSRSEGPRFLPSDFKKKGGFKRSLELSAEYGLYRQDYCGCAYSKANKNTPLPSER